VHKRKQPLQYFPAAPYTRTTALRRKNLVREAGHPSKRPLQLASCSQTPAIECNQSLPGVALHIALLRQVAWLMHSWTLGCCLGTPGLSWAKLGMPRPSSA
jgi:hypothetical protein